MLANRGHSVHWWTSSFDHQLKVQRTPRYRQISWRPDVNLHLLPGRPYASNVSLRRIGNHRDNAAAFRALAPLAGPVPDIILCSYPTGELCEAAIDFGVERSVPVVVDIRDLWPDIFEGLVPRWVRPALHALLFLMRQQSRRVCSRATAITGVTAEFVDWGLKRGGRSANEADRAFPMAYVENPPSEAELSAARAKWNEMGVTADQLNLVFFGTIGRQFDLSTVISAARQVDDPRIRFVICGSGDKLKGFRDEAADCTNVLFPGWIGAAMIRSLMSISFAGLAPYHVGDDFNNSIPNKVIEYLAGGLPIITTLSGVSGTLLADNRCGLTYAQRSPASLLQAIAALTSAPLRRNDMAANAHALFRERFDAERVYGAMIDHLETIARVAGIDSVAHRPTPMLAA
jgi:glycosyltransferase involved in cell wall biosynthesis